MPSRCATRKEASPHRARYANPQDLWYRAITLVLFVHSVGEAVLVTANPNLGINLRARCFKLQDLFFCLSVCRGDAESAIVKFVWPFY